MGLLFSKPLQEPSKPIYSTPSKNNKNKGLSVSDEIVIAVESSSIVEVLFQGGSKNKKKTRKNKLFQK